MKRIFRLITVAALALWSAGSAEAITINITPGTTPVWTGTDPSNLDSSQIGAIVGNTVTCLYKKEAETGTETATFASSYETSFIPTSAEASAATITYVGGTAISSPTSYLYVKDGNSNPAFYIFNLTALGWTGIETLSLSGFWDPGTGAISNLAIYGGGPTNVPDGGTTAVLLGFALVAFGLVKRRLQTVHS
jgi:hypothetical protein